MKTIISGMQEMNPKPQNVMLSCEKKSFIWCGKVRKISPCVVHIMKKCKPSLHKCNECQSQIKNISCKVITY
jgi:hypothetical protein